MLFSILRIPSSGTAVLKLRSICSHLIRVTAVTIGVSSFAALAAATATAQTWLAAEGPTRGSDAKGAVIWSHGRSTSAEDWKTATPPYVAALREGGWDTFRFNRWRDGDTLPDSAAALLAEVQKLKDRGYARVVLAGQSFGAFLSLMVADRSDQVDGVIATAPAAFGDFSASYASWWQNADALYPLLERIGPRARVMVFYFHGDDFDPGGRGQRSREILETRGVDHVVVDQPAQLIGHWAAATVPFAQRFAPCMLDFIDVRRHEAGAQCESTASAFHAVDVLSMKGGSRPLAAP
jgi:pimeloyl-ACP methyl ester carboxylesterase